MATPITKTTWNSFFSDPTNEKKFKACAITAAAGVVLLGVGAYALLNLTFPPLAVVSVMATGGVILLISCLFLKKFNPHNQPSRLKFTVKEDLNPYNRSRALRLLNLTEEESRDECLVKQKYENILFDFNSRMVNISTPLANMLKERVDNIHIAYKTVTEMTSVD